ncbi:hypothetical protein SUGI_1184160 [Cryptomeria japonica]|nr:hypothetical protein SUGI_1184160 [Cryptomeria japonica]
MRSYLFDKKDPNDIECWKVAVLSIGGNACKSTVLQISYDRLNDIEKETFLDIACCLVGEKKIEAVILWKASRLDEVHIAIKNLSLKMLISTSGSMNCLEMHALV